MITPVLDHLVLDVHTDMDAVADLYRRLGFTLTDRGHHTLGSINHLAMFDTDYLELLGWPEGSEARAELRQYPRGLNGLVFKTDDADATYATLQAAGLAAAPPRAFSRPVLLNGETSDAKFRTVHVTPDKARLGRIYFCEHLTPDLVWRPEWQRHPNGVTAIDSIVIESPDPNATTALFRAMFGNETTPTLQAGRPRIEIKQGGNKDRITTIRFAGKSAQPIPAEQAGNVRLEFV